MKKTNKRQIIILAYANRYFYPILILVFVLYCNFLLTGIALLVFSTYQFIGYKCKWKHIYCSYQNAYRKKMTPNNINWNKVKKSDAYGIPVIFGVIGIMCIILYFIK